MGQDVQVLKRKVEQWGGIEVSRLGFGAMRLPVREDGKIDRDKAGPMLERAIQGGVNYFDSAYVYHGGESEQFLGDMLKPYPRDSYYLATKLPVFIVDAEEKVAVLFKEQLARLQTSYVDLYMLHGLSGARLAHIQKLKIPEKLVQMKKDGLIRNMGFSFHGDPDSFRTLIDMGIWDFAQIQINYLDDEMINAKALYDTLVAANIPAVCMEPVRGGYLANPPDDVRAMMAGFEGGAVTPAGWSLRWCIGKDNMPVILSGMSTMEQVEENLATFTQDSKLTPAQEKMLASAAESITAIRAIPCTACRYCMECPSGVNIPEIFQVYNRFKLFKNAFRANEDYRAVKNAGNGPEKCTACGACSPQCPQEIDIPAELEVAKELLENVWPPA